MDVHGRRGLVSGKRGALQVATWTDSRNGTWWEKRVVILFELLCRVDTIHNLAQISLVGDAKLAWVHRKPN